MNETPNNKINLPPKTLKEQEEVHSRSQKRHRVILGSVIKEIPIAQVGEDDLSSFIEAIEADIDDGKNKTMTDDEIVAYAVVRSNMRRKRELTDASFSLNTGEQKKVSLTKDGSMKDEENQAWSDFEKEDASEITEIGEKMDMVNIDNKIDPIVGAYNDNIRPNDVIQSRDYRRGLQEEKIELANQQRDEARAKNLTLAKEVDSMRNGTNDSWTNRELEIEENSNREEKGESKQRLSEKQKDLLYGAYPKDSQQYVSEVKQERAEYQEKIDRAISTVVANLPEEYRQEGTLERIEFRVVDALREGQDMETFVPQLSQEVLTDRAYNTGFDDVDVLFDDLSRSVQNSNRENVSQAVSAHLQSGANAEKIKDIRLVHGQSLETQKRESVLQQEIGERINAMDLPESYTDNPERSARLLEQNYQLGMSDNELEQLVTTLDKHLGPQGPLLEYKDWKEIVDAITTKEHHNKIAIGGAEYTVLNKGENVFSVEGPDGIIDPISHAELIDKLSKDEAQWNGSVSEEYLNVRQFATDVVDNLDVDDRGKSLFQKAGLGQLEVMHTIRQSDEDGAGIIKWSIKMPGGVEKEFSREDLRQAIIDGIFVTQEQIDLGHHLDVFDFKAYEKANKTAFEKPKDIKDQTYIEYIQAQLDKSDQFKHVPDSSLTTEQINKRILLQEEARVLGLIQNNDEAKQQASVQLGSTFLNTPAGFLKSIDDINKSYKIELSASIVPAQKAVDALKKAVTELAQSDKPEQRREVKIIKEKLKAAERHLSDVTQQNEAFKSHEAHHKAITKIEREAYQRKTGDLRIIWDAAKISGHFIGQQLDDWSAWEANTLMNIDKNVKNPIIRGAARGIIGNSRAIVGVGGLFAAGAFPIIGLGMLAGAGYGLFKFLSASFARGKKIMG